MPGITNLSILASIGAVTNVFVMSTCLAVATIVLVHALRRARGTTLAAPVVWSFISLATLSIVSVAWCRSPWTIPPFVNNYLFLLAAASTLCPMIAILGAKRPQSRAWQFIVISFWFIAAWPAIQAPLYPGEMLYVPAFWQWLYGAILLIEVVNYSLTFFCTAALLAAVGQFLILSFFRGGICLLAAAAVWASLLRRWRNFRRAARNSGWARVWLDFRDDYGLVWGARVMDRINALAASLGANVALDWKGFYLAERAAGGSDSLAGRRLPAAAHEFAKLEPGIRNILRRFVSDEWIDARLGGRPKEPPGSTAVSSPASAS